MYHQDVLHTNYFIAEGSQASRKPIPLEISVKREQNQK